MSHPADVYMPFFIADFFGSERVEEIEPLAKWLYVCLLTRQWTHGSLPAEPAKLKRLYLELERDFDRLWPQVEQFFPKHPTLTGRIANARGLHERRLAEERVDTASERARALAAKRWGKGRISGASCAGNATGDAGAIPVSDRNGSERNGVESPTDASALPDRTEPEFPDSVFERVWWAVREAGTGLGFNAPSPEPAVRQAFADTGSWRGWYDTKPDDKDFLRGRFVKRLRELRAESQPKERRA